MKEELGISETPFKKTAKNSRKRTMTSAQVFSLFIGKTKAQEFGDEILSYECFRLWVCSRNAKVLHPEESFRRTLVAHVRGVYGRKPFSADVEASLLKLLRRVNVDGDVSFDPWSRCFPGGNTLHIGKRGFNKKGYHEVQRDISLAQSVKIEESLERDFPEDHLPKTRSERKRKGERTSYENINIESIETLKRQRTDFISWFQCSSAVRLLYETAMLHHTMSGWMSNISLSLTTRYSFEELVKLFDSMLQVGFIFESPAVQFNLRLENPFIAMNLPLQFVFPNPDSVRLAHNRLSGKVLFSLKTWLVVDDDMDTRKLLLRSVRDMHIFHILESGVEWLLVFPRLLHLLESQPEVWLRLKLLRGDGAVGMYLIKAQLRSEDFVVLILQDNSEFFPDALNVRRLA